MTELLNSQVYTTDGRWQWWQGIKKRRAPLLDGSFGLEFCSTIGNITTSKLAWLAYLHLAGSAITGIIPPTKLQQCQDLNLNDDQITNIAPLRIAPLKHQKYPHPDSIELAGKPIDTPNRCLH